MCAVCVMLYILLVAWAYVFVTRNALVRLNASFIPLRHSTMLCSCRKRALRRLQDFWASFDLIFSVRCFTVVPSSPGCSCMDPEPWPSYSVAPNIWRHQDACSNLLKHVSTLPRTTTLDEMASVDNTCGVLQALAAWSLVCADTSRGCAVSQYCQPSAWHLPSIFLLTNERRMTTLMVSNNCNFHIVHCCSSPEARSDWRFQRWRRSALSKIIPGQSRFGVCASCIWRFWVENLVQIFLRCVRLHLATLATTPTSKVTPATIAIVSFTFLLAQWQSRILLIFWSKFDPWVRIVIILLLLLF